MSKPQLLHWSSPIAFLISLAGLVFWMGSTGSARDLTNPAGAPPATPTPEETAEAVGAVTEPVTEPDSISNQPPVSPPDSAQKQLIWDTDLPALPTEDLGADGLSGVFAGVHHGALLLIGGSHYSNTRPWDGGTKTYLQRGWFLFPDLRGNFTWRALPEPALPTPLAHGTSISTPWGVVVLGGNHQTECSTMARLLTWDGDKERLVIRDLPPLPEPLTRAAGVMHGTTIYLLGGEHEAPAGEPSHSFLSLDLGAWVSDPESADWQKLPPWQGPARSLAAAGVTSDGTEDCLFLFGGRGLDADGRTLALADAHKFTPSQGRWTRVADIAPDDEPVRGIMAAAAAPGDAHELLVFGGDDNLMADVYHLLSQRVITSGDDAEAWRNLNRAILENHPGYPREILSYNALEDRWSAVGHFPAAAPLANPVVDFAVGLVIPGGETTPGRRSNEVLRVTWQDRVVIRRALPAEQPTAPEAAPVEEQPAEQAPPPPYLRPGDDPALIFDERQAE